MPLTSDTPFGYEILLRHWQGISLAVFNQSPILYSEFSYALWKAMYQLDNAGKCRSKGQKLFVNMTVAQLLSTGSLKFLIVLDQNKLSFCDLVIELTENNLGEMSSALFERVLLFKRFNCEFAIDDFGRQSSNFSHIFEFKPDYLKVDRSLICKAATSLEQQSVLRSLVKFCHEQDIKVIMEGVETQADVDMMKSCNADFSQGFYFGLPQLITNTDDDSVEI
ncbi:MAG: EAL domain-containing protein (putative c-di-GMP-specific phosphodiesterase class I) [Colwellia sp.]|jgi:EAL domain-containing protein (putative c-di-GMP-specific phosphodiesterase class I)